MVSHYFELLLHYRRMVTRIFLVLVGGVAVFSALLLFITPLYTASVKVNLLPTNAELAFTSNFVRGSSTNPATLMSQTHMEYLLSREVAQDTVDRIIAEYGDPSDAAPSGLRAWIGKGFQAIRRTIRTSYNILNSGKHVPLDPYTDAILTLQDSIDVEMVEGTYILELSVTWDSPELAAAAANLLADVYVTRARQQADEAAERMERELQAQAASGQADLAVLTTQIEALRLARATGFDMLRVIEAAVAPIYPSFPKVVINIILAGIGAVALSAFALVSADTFSDTVKTRHDLERVMAGLSLPTLRLGPGGALRRDRGQQAEIARTIRLRVDLMTDAGAVVALGSDRDSDMVAALVDTALWPRQGRPQHRERAPAAAPRKLSLVGGSRAMLGRGGGELRPAVGAEDALSPAAGAGQGTVPGGPVDQPVTLRLGATVGVVSLGGAAEGFSLTSLTPPRWIVVAMRPGSIGETELRGMLEDWGDRGVGHVFGVMMNG
ncbi:MAG: hypothetical protein R3D84_06720 [Paracoccaceae bacterium]